MNIKSIILVIVVVVVGVTAGLEFAATPNRTAAILATVGLALASLLLISRETNDRRFLIGLWLGALVVRLIVATAVYKLNLRTRIAPDWGTYDAFGYQLANYWHGTGSGSWLLAADSQYRSGWGMYYYVAALYYVIGRNALAVQWLSCVFGANACVLIYQSARMVYPVQRVARMAAVLTALAPSMVIWSSQGIKEPLILFLLAAILFLTMRLTRGIKFQDAALLILSLVALYSLRHYVFYVVFLAASAAILLSGREISAKRLLQGSALVLVIGLAFTYYGAGNVAEKTLDLKRIQEGREWSARVSDSGYGGGVDITDTRAALVYLPLGTFIFLFAPLPWMIRNINHLVLLPEMIVWWLSTPFLVRGFWFSIRWRLRGSLAICLFAVGLTFAYALYLTNFGTAHRMRVQVLGFFVIFVSVGWELRRAASERRRIGQASRFPVLRPMVSDQLPGLRDRRVS